MTSRDYSIVRLSIGALLIGMTAASSHAEPRKSDQMLPTGQRITPEAASGALFQNLDPELPGHPDYRAGSAVTTVVSHDGKTLLVLTSGFNRLAGSTGKLDPAAASEYVFVFDISGGAPKKTQILQVLDTDSGIVFAPDDRRFYVSGGVDDNVHTFANKDGKWSEGGAPIALGHKAGVGLDIKPSAAGLDISSDGSKLVIADRQNDAITLIVNNVVTAELDLRPGKNDPAKHGQPGGEYPDWVSIKGNDTAYVSSQRDREIVVVDIRDVGKPVVTARIPIDGVPNRTLLNKDQSLLYVAADNSDRITVVDTSTNSVRQTFSAAPPQAAAGKKRFAGAAPNGLALSSDGAVLYVSEGGINALAVIPLASPDKIGFMPTGWYPNSVSASGGMLYAVNSRSNTGPNPLGCTTNPDKAKTAACEARNHYVLQLSKAGLLSLPVPKPEEQSELTRIVASNNGLSLQRDPEDQKLMAALRARIKHVIYIVKENRTYDQVLGDLKPGNGDPSLTLFGENITPNLHALARRFVTLDNFYDPGEVSGNGWPWSVSARETDVGVKAIALYYGERGQSYDVEGPNRSINVALPSTAERRAANARTPDDDDILPGTADVAAPDSSGGEQDHGHIWDDALSAGLTVRNYGFFCDLTRYSLKDPSPIPLERDPSKAKITVAIPAATGLQGITDPYYRSFDVKYPDFYREREWEREFKAYVVHRNLPNLSLVRLMEDHMGDFGHAIDGVASPEAQVADNDYAVGKLIETVSKSRYRDSTLIFVVEDDAQDGPDHVDAHRSIAFIAGPYVKQGAVVSTRYSTVNMLRTIEDVLGIEPLSVNDANQPPMSSVFDLKAKKWSFAAKPSAALLSTKLPLHQKNAAGAGRFRFAQSTRYWTKMTENYDWSKEDRIDASAFNRILWQGLKTGSPYPEKRRGGVFHAN